MAAVSFWAADAPSDDASTAERSPTRYRGSLGRARTYTRVNFEGPSRAEEVPCPRLVGVELSQPLLLLASPSSQTRILRRRPRRRANARDNAGTCSGRARCHRPHGRRESRHQRHRARWRSRCVGDRELRHVQPGFPLFGGAGPYFAPGGYAHFDPAQIADFRVSSGQISFVPIRRKITAKLPGDIQFAGDWYVWQMDYPGGGKTTNVQVSYDQTLNLSNLVLALMQFPIALFLGATAAVALQTRALPRWLGWLGAVVAVVGLAGASGRLLAANGTLGLVGFLLLLMWLLATSIVLTRRASARQSVPSEGAVAALAALR
jgi:hypothetical protein